MAHTQSPMMQQPQANPAYQASSDMNGWAQGSMGGNRYAALASLRQHRGMSGDHMPLFCSFHNFFAQAGDIK